jgi:hypothetical protein
MAGFAYGQKITLKIASKITLTIWIYFDNIAVNQPLDNLFFNL